MGLGLGLGVGLGFGIGSEAHQAGGEVLVRGEVRGEAARREAQLRGGDGGEIEGRYGGFGVRLGFGLRFGLRLELGVGPGATCSWSTLSTTAATWLGLGLGVRVRVRR